MKLTVERDFENHSFHLVDEGGKKLGEVAFDVKDDILTVDHTTVSSVLRGSGEGIRLVDEVVAYAKEAGYTVNATCKYAKKMFVRHLDRYGEAIMAPPIPDEED